MDYILHLRQFISHRPLLMVGATVIAASALKAGLGLVTTNARHFPMPDLTIWQADETGNLKPR